MGREPQIGRVVPGCSQNSRHPLLSSSVILSMKCSFLTTASHYKMAALLSDSQCHLRSEKENQDNSGRSCVSFSSVQFSSVQLLSRVRLFATPWIAACQASLSITNSRSSLKLVSIESVMPSFSEGKTLQKPATAFPLCLSGEICQEVNPGCKAVWQN